MPAEEERQHGKGREEGRPRTRSVDYEEEMGKASEEMRAMETVIKSEGKHLQKLSVKQRFAFCGLIAQAFHSVFLGTEGRQWCEAVLRIIVRKHLGLPEEKVQALIPLLPTCDGCNLSADSRPLEGDSPWLMVLKDAPDGDGSEADERNMAMVLKELLLLLVVIPGYDARIRTMVKVLAAELEVSSAELRIIEESIAVYLQDKLEDFRKSTAAAKANQSDWSRYAKIGAASALAGTALAVTGGLAAPAIIGAGATIFGTSALSAALLSSSGLALMTAVFGTAGAGLGGYKMDRRTSNISEFDFKLRTGGRCMAIYICISGWIEADDGDEAERDFLKPWGDVRERLRCFYRLHNPAKLGSVDQLAAQFTNKEEQLFKKIEEHYQVSSVIRPESQSHKDGQTEGEASKATDREDKPLPLTDQSSEAKAGAPVDKSQSTKPIPSVISQPPAEGQSARTYVWQDDLREFTLRGVSEGAPQTIWPSPVHISSLSPVQNALAARLNPLVRYFHRAWFWRERVPTGDQLCLQWESEVLRSLGTNMRNFLLNESYKYAMNSILQQTIGAIMAAIALPSFVLKACSWIDDVWVLARNRSDKAGKLLAEVLLSRVQGQRPVTLMGYSMGARVIVKCLEELAKQGHRGAGIVENAVILGAPVSTSKSMWRQLRGVVSGRLINGFSRNDWMMMLMYRYKGWALTVAGIETVNVPGVENLDLSDVIGGHLEYREKIGDVLDLIHLEDDWSKEADERHHQAFSSVHEKEREEEEDTRSEGAAEDERS